MTKVTPKFVSYDALLADAQRGYDYDEGVLGKLAEEELDIFAKNGMTFSERLAEGFRHAGIQ